MLNLLLLHLKAQIGINQNLILLQYQENIDVNIGLLPEKACSSRYTGFVFINHKKQTGTEAACIHMSV